MSELKPCPFCGGEAFVRIDIALNPRQSRYRVGCDKNSYCHGWYGHSRYYNTEAGAAAAWNTRHVETCHNASYRLDESRFHCSECGFGCWVKDVADGRDKLPKFCPNCGRKVEG